MSDTVTLTQADLDNLLQQAREAAIQAVISLTTPVEEDEKANARSMRAFDISDSNKVAKSKIGKATAKFWGQDGPHSPATFRMRKRIAAFADLKSGGTAVSDRIFRGPLTRAQATTASAVLETGRAVQLDDLEILAR